jgi:hypothetical protein
MDYSSVVFSAAFGYGSNSVGNLPVRWLLSLDDWLRFIDEIGSTSRRWCPSAFVEERR